MGLDEDILVHLLFLYCVIYTRHRISAHLLGEVLVHWIIPLGVSLNTTDSGEILQRGAGADGMRRCPSDSLILDRVLSMGVCRYLSPG